MSLINRQSSVPLNRPPKVPYDTFMGIAWGGTAVALIFLLGRLYTKIHIHRALFFDDFLVIFAWVLLLINTVFWQMVAKYMYMMLNVEAGSVLPGPTFLDNVDTYLVHVVPIQIFFDTGLWAVKLSFLVFFRRLGSMVRGQKIHWWAVFVLIVVTWIIRLSTTPYRCILPPLSYSIEHCVSKKATGAQRSILMYNTVMDVITDVVIITIPLHLLWNVQINLKQKVLLMGIFSLTVVIMVFAIMRSLLVVTYSRMPDASWLFMWTSIEQAVSILIACLASFRSLFVRHDPSQQAHSGSWLSVPSWSPRPLLSKASKLFTTSTHHETSSLNSSISSIRRGNTPFMSTNRTTISTDKSQMPAADTVPRQAIRVTREIDVSHLQEVMSNEKLEV